MAQASSLWLRAHPRYRFTALVALVLLMGAVAIGSGAPQVAVVLAGLGNAAFHVGAGAIILRLSPNRAAAAGVFVALGSIGLAVGNWAGRSLAFWPWISLALLLVGADRRAEHEAPPAA